eukprot:CAMPEP_0114232516 /NCGR_PEP_ID=MMETSP0058-20121206/4649_1 /TAXON_ID=36894 /ORGANISM="Pyramimonas parkeae, CCMP726" /LENGTH=300 /DNA_ID=CAMNT_0001343997 /DNA_START=175 /DNA_END=1077 /DNA_ORIENTATION=-
MSLLGKRGMETVGMDAPVSKAQCSPTDTTSKKQSLRPSLPSSESSSLLAPLTPSPSLVDVHSAEDYDLSQLSHSTVGAKGTLEYRMYFEHGLTGRISPWHDIPLVSKEGGLNFLCEIPKWTRAKFEVNTTETGNPIKQDEKKGVPREYKWGDMMFNYGMFPQTWEDPAVISTETGCKGDGDPLDVIEVGSRQMSTGEVCAVKVLGVLAMIDDGETDWKVIAIRTDDRLATHMSDVADLEREMPGAVHAIREWLRVYKVPEGKPENEFAMEERALPRDFAMHVIEETHGLWKGKYGSHAQI